MTLTKLSLFSGIGGDDLASDWAGIKTVCFVEKDKFCQQVLKKHWPNTLIIEDVKDVKKELITGNIDIIGGGFPCQPFSSNGHQRAENDDRYLWPEMLRIISELQPTWVIGENVGNLPNLVFSNNATSMEDKKTQGEYNHNSNILDGICSAIEYKGYEVQAVVIPACAIGAFHIRNRVFIIAHATSKRWDETKIQKGITSKGQRISRQYSNAMAQTIQKMAYPNRSGDYDGIPRELDANRLRTLGNAVVPQQIYPIYKAIVEIDANK